MGTDEVRWPPEEAGTSLVVRRLRRLEKSARDAETVEGWRAALESELGLVTDCESNWVCDARLVDFFAHEASLPDKDRVSTAVTIGFR